MSFIEDLKELANIGRRFEQYRLESEKEKSALLRQISELKTQLARARGYKEPRPKDEPPDSCKRCLWRIKVMSDLPKSTERGRM